MAKLNPYLNFRETLKKLLVFINPYLAVILQEEYLGLQILPRPIK